MTETKNLMDINIDALYNILKQNQCDVNDAMGYKKKIVVVTSDPLALVAEKTKANDGKKQDMSKVKCYNCKKEEHFAKYCKKAKVKDCNYYKEKMLLAKKDNDEQVLLGEDQAWMESSSNSDQELSAKKVSYYSYDSENDSQYKTSYYYDNSTNYGLFVDNDDDQEIFHDATETASKFFDENHIVSQKDHNELEVDHNVSKDKDS
ncbi:reverse transcriptase domain-containing protein [Tanacetum coccineum]